MKKVHDLETEGKVVNKSNRNKDSFHVSKDIIDTFAKNIIEKTTIIFHSSFFANVNQTDSQSVSNWFSRESRSSSIPDFDIIANTPAVPHINHDAENIRDTESLADNMFEKLNPILGWGERGGGCLESTPINIREISKTAYSTDLRFEPFNIYNLGLFSQNFRSVSLFLGKLERFCRGWFEKFCLVMKIQHFLPYLKTQVKR